MTNAEKALLRSICKSSINKYAAKNKIDFHFLVVSESTFNKYWRIFGAKDWNVKKEEKQ